MDEKSGLLEQLKKYQHQNKNLLSENAKLHAKSKRLKMEKKQLKLQLSQMQNNRVCESHGDIATKTLEFVNHHHIEMQKMIGHLLTHPTIIQSSTHKDLQYISSKLAYIHSKVDALTNGKTCISSPQYMHSYRKSSTNTSSNSMSETGSDSSYVSMHKKHKYSKKYQHTHYPTVHHLSSHSSVPMHRVHIAHHNTFDGNYRMHSQTGSDQSLRPQLRQLDLDKYLNKNKTVDLESIPSENENLTPLVNINNNLSLPMNKHRSISSMNVSRATSIMGNIADELSTPVIDTDIPSLPSSPPMSHTNILLPQSAQTLQYYEREIRSLSKGRKKYRDRPKYKSKSDLDAQSVVSRRNSLRNGTVKHTKPSSAKFDPKHISMQLESHVCREKQLHSLIPVPVTPATDSDEQINKSNSVVVHESPTFSPLSSNLVKKYNQRTPGKISESDGTVSISNVNFVYEFNSEHGSNLTSTMAKQDSIQSISFPTVSPANSFFENSKLKQHCKSKTFQDHLLRQRAPPPNVHLKDAQNLYSLRIDVSEVRDIEKLKAHKRNRRHSSGKINTQPQPLPENVENLSKWKFSSSTLEKSKLKLHPKSKSMTTSLNSHRKRSSKKQYFLEKRVSVSASSTSSLSNMTNDSDCNSAVNEEHKQMGNTTDGESDEYYDSSVELIEYSVGIAEGEHKQLHDCEHNPKSYTIDVTPLNSEGVGDDDFFDSTNQNVVKKSTPSPWKLSNDEKNIFVPSALSPYGFLAKTKGKRSNTFCAIDMYSNKRKSQIKGRYKKAHKNGFRKHNSAAYIQRDTGTNVEQIKQEMLDEYQQNLRRNSIELEESKTLHNIEEEKKELSSPRGGHTNYLSPQNFFSDSDGSNVPALKRRLSLKEKQKLLVIDDLIASILEDKDSYLMTKALLLSYRAFTTAQLLMKVLRRRFRVPHDYVDRQRLKNNKSIAIEDESKVVEFNEKEVAFKIQLGICQIIYAWMHQYWEEDFVNHPMLQKEIFEFQRDIEKFIVDKTQTNVIAKLLKEPKNLSSQNALFATKSVSNLSRSMQSFSHSRSIISMDSESESKSMSLASKLEDAKEEIRTRYPHLIASNIMAPKDFVVLNYKPSEIAKQIILMDYCVFKEIRAREVVAQAWKKKDKWEKATNILRMINQFNSVCRWTQICIIHYGSTPKQRAKMVKQMILIAQTLYKYQDFSSLVAVHSALVSTPIKRLTKSWKKVNKKYIKIISQISKLFEWNSPKLMQLHSKDQLKGPIIPHLGIILKNVISIEESDEYNRDGTINTHKMNLLAKQIEKLNNWQLKCNKIYNPSMNERKINKNNKRFIIGKDLVLQKLLFRDFQQQIGITDDDIFKMTDNKHIQ